MQPIIYKSTDTSAPQLSATAGSMNAVIKSCLITGYGSKASAGWEVVYEDLATKKLAIRSTNIKSIKSMLLLDNANSDHASVTAYKTWSNVTNTGGDSFGAGYFVNKWNINTPNWVVIATDSFFYLFVQLDPAPANARVMSGFGDASMIASGEGASVLLSSPSTTDTPQSTGYEAIQTSLGVSAKFPMSLFLKYSTSYATWGDRSAVGATGSISSLAILSRFALYTLRGGSNQPTLDLPGMLMPFSEIAGYESVDNIDTISGQSPYFNPILGMYQPYHGRVWIHTDDWE